MDCSLPGSTVHADSLGKNIGVGCQFLLQGIFSIQELNPDLLHCRQILYQLSYEGSQASYHSINSLYISQLHMYNSQQVIDQMTPSSEGPNFIPFATSGGRWEVQPLRLTSLVRLHLDGITQSPLRAAHCCRGWNKISETISTSMGAHQVHDTEPDFWNKLIQSK